MLVPIAAPVVISLIPDKTSISVTWMMLDCQDRHGDIIMYEVRYLRFGESVYQTLNNTFVNENLLLLNLEEFTNYTIQVRAYTAVGPGPYSAPMDVQTLEDCKHHYYMSSA